ncbi:unnamed protein product [Cylindrotheca closterium]|uniref:Cyclic nucleotide-binding domain-containing protein n=1 Tax=Cylindrotheca closterium TaxID=2856 RepID=A0AAD2FP07_9STRA|nr:unnamed protein product [Cylindrotheca closterium]
MTFAISKRFTSSKVNPPDVPKPSKVDAKMDADSSIWNNRADFFNRKRFLDHNLSELAGNLSSFLVLAAYTMTDIFALRLVSLVATSLALVFQYYRKIPLWIPIRWNLVLVLINGAMVTKLHLERQRADSMTPTMQELFEKGHFQQRGFSKVEFLRLYELAQVVKVPPGTVVVKKGQAKHSLQFLIEGSVDVLKNGKKVAQLEQYKFIGEISLLGRMLLNNMDTGASADVVVRKNKDATFLVWEFDELIPYLQQDRQVWNALASYLNYDLTSKLLRDGMIQRASSANHPLVLQKKPLFPPQT